ncbi:DUF3823 domain-containing protein [Chitinophagaceae bacterium LB-8]|uniref:DUF3823 domain-containing protein n=1 Tax=Paraflavisolibacter caeni TaxID=2982496 RepID=A0A9X3B762_9BACT|nr:DUF3823 domain-containing protein [Paraflavisolibacter caeni]MCU7548870.1 DUF3823 domain-containing protein [Paraflavisolibacter caeni]
MRNKFFSLLSAAILLFSAGCKKDNYEAPKSVLSGRVVFQKQAVNVRSNAVQLELWQYGYKLLGKIPVYIAQDGTFSAELFDGNYKLVRLAGGPWSNGTDSIDVKVDGATTLDVPVDPYYMVGNESFTFNKADTTIRAIFKVSQLSSAKAIEKISLNMGLTQIVDLTNRIPITGDDFNPPSDISQPITLTLSVNPDRYPDQQGLNRAELRRQLSMALTKKYGYLRVGVKAAGVAERTYTPVKMITLQ